MFVPPPQLLIYFILFSFYFLCENAETFIIYQHVVIIIAVYTALQLVGASHDGVSLSELEGDVEKLFKSLQVLIS